jgi:hypothetical protein
VAILKIFLMQQETMLRPKLFNYATAMMTEINPAINYGRSTFGMRYAGYPSFIKISRSGI